MMNNSFKGKQYAYSLFFGHLVLEKILKAHVVKTTKKHAPYIHNLLNLSEKAGLNLSRAEKDLFNEVNSFNLRTRYPDHKFEFYKKWNKNNTKAYLDKIKLLYKKLCQKLK